MAQKRRMYLAYLLRLWRAGDLPPGAKVNNWRASLESPQRGACLGFGSLEELFTFLTEEVMRCEAESAVPTDENQFDS